MQYDLLLKNGYVVDYATDTEKYTDVAVKEGKIVKIAEDIDKGTAAEIFDVEGATVIPGIIDSHMHASSWLGGESGH